MTQPNYNNYLKKQFAIYIQDSREYGSYVPYIAQYRSKYRSHDPYIAQHRSKYGSYDPYMAQHNSKYGSYDPNIAQHRKKYRKFENPKFCRKIQMFKMTQKSFSAYPKIPKSDFVPTIAIRGFANQLFR